MVGPPENPLGQFWGETPLGGKTPAKKLRGEGASTTKRWGDSPPKNYFKEGGEEPPYNKNKGGPPPFGGTHAGLG